MTLIRCLAEQAGGISIRNPANDGLLPDFVTGREPGIPQMCRSDAAEPQSECHIIQAVCLWSGEPLMEQPYREAEAEFAVSALETAAAKAGVTGRDLPGSRGGGRHQRVSAPKL